MSERVVRKQSVHVHSISVRVRMCIFTGLKCVDACWVSTSLECGCFHRVFESLCIFTGFLRVCVFFIGFLRVCAFSLVI